MKVRRKILSIARLFFIGFVLITMVSLNAYAASIDISTGYYDFIAALANPLYDEINLVRSFPGPPLHDTVTIPLGKTVTIKSGVTVVSIPGKLSYINNGTLILEDNSEISPANFTDITNNGTIINMGTIDVNFLTNNGAYSGTGTVTTAITGNNVYAVTFDENYTGAPVPTLVNVYDTTVGTTLMPADPSRAGYTFMGWNTAADGSGTAFNSTTALSVLGTTSPVTATVYAQWLSKACDITGFTLPNQVGAATINGANISVTVPFGTDVTALIPTIAVSNSATVLPASGAADDFTNPVTYTVTAADGTTKQYIVTVTVGVQVTYAVTVTSGTGGGSYPQGATVNITADNPPAGQIFDKWISSDVTFANENMAATRFTMPAKAVSITATYKASPPTATKHTITLGASGDGVVSGGGTFDENTTITVTATPKTGNSFVNWTENGAEVSNTASYSFVVTAARTLVANFKADDAPEPPVDPPVDPPTTPSYSGGSSSSGGSSKADTSPVMQTGRAFTKAEAVKLFNTALAAKPEGQTSLSFRARNYTSVDKTVLAELAALAKKNGITLTVHFDTVVGKAVTYRISVNPAAVTTSLDLTAKIVGAKITLPKFSPAVEVAVKMPVGLTIENLKITQNGKEITNAKPWLDKNGYLHFTTTGGEIVLGK